MRLVVADTSPIRYLVRIGEIELFAPLIREDFLPSVVADELCHPSAPAAVREWIKQPPSWLEVLAVTGSNDPALSALDDGEKSAIALGLALKADLILIDEHKGAAAALRKGFEVTGTLGALDLAALARLGNTNFRYRPELFDALLKKHRSGRA